MCCIVTDGISKCDYQFSTKCRCKKIKRLSFHLKLCPFFKNVQDNFSSNQSLSNGSKKLPIVVKNCSTLEIGY